MAKIKRSIENTILKINEKYPVLMLTGAKGSGRTTLIKMLETEGMKYLSLDDKELRSLIKKDPAVFFQCTKPPIAISDIQYGLQLIPYINQYTSENPKGGEFRLLATHMCDLLENVGETMGDNIGIANLMGLTYEEITGDPIDLDRIDWVEQNEIDAQIIRGGMPALYGDGIDINKDRYFDQYMHEFLRDEVKGMTSVTDIMKFRRFMVCAAARSGELVNYAALAKDTDISQPTAKQWLSILISSGIVGLIKPFNHEKLTRSIQVPRMYFLDTGLCAYLAEIKKPEKLFKTWVVTEIMKRYYNAGIKPPLYHYRDKDGKEVDLIIEEDGKLEPFEIIDPCLKPKERAKRFEGFAKKGIQMMDCKVIQTNRI